MVSAETLLICPTYSLQTTSDYALIAVRSFLETTESGHCLVIDDASPGYDLQKMRELLSETEELFPGRLFVYRFPQWGGLTRSWNRGLLFAKEQKYRYAIAGNSDLLFTPGWLPPLEAAIDAGYALAGPVTNAPGITSEGVADVSKYVPNYRVTDDDAYLRKVSSQLQTRWTGKSVPVVGLNGFCLFAKTSRWFSGRYTHDLVFCPSNDYGRDGRVNPTPLMTLNEDELQDRWRQKDWKFAVAPASFVFHYRSVTRGVAYAKKGWFRRR